MSTLTRRSEFQSAASNELADLLAASLPERVCAGCDCTDTNACIDPETGKPCHWVEGYVENVCSVCDRVLRAMNAAEEQEFSPAGEPRRVQLYSDADASRYLAQRVSL